MKFQIEIQKDYKGFNLIIGIPIMDSIAFYKQALSRFISDEGDFIKWNEFSGLLTKHTDLLIIALNEALANKGYKLVCSMDLEGIKIQ